MPRSTLEIRKYIKGENKSKNINGYKYITAQLRKTVFQFNYEFIVL